MIYSHIKLLSLFSSVHLAELVFCFTLVLALASCNDMQHSYSRNGRVKHVIGGGIMDSSIMKMSFGHSVNSRARDLSLVSKAFTVSEI
jgi:hypothetical protein